MKPNASSQAVKRPVGAERPFPWRCRHCGNDAVFPEILGYDADEPHDGRVHAFHIPKLEAPVCRSCEKMVVTESVDDQINAALRNHLRLLTPAEIEAALNRVGLTQKEAAERLGIAEATLSRWLNGAQIQTRAYDNWMRAFFGFPAVRSAFCGETQDPTLGTVDKRNGQKHASKSSKERTRPRVIKAPRNRK